jgi:hypothetical protein
MQIDDGRCGAVPFLYYLGFIGVLATGFVVSAFLRGAETPTVAAVGRVNSDAAPLQKLQREIAIRRGVVSPEQEEHVELTVYPGAEQTETAAVTPARTAISETKAEQVKADSAPAVDVQPKQAAPARRTRPKEAAKCAPGECETKQARSVWTASDRLP